MATTCGHSLILHENLGLEIMNDIDQLQEDLDDLKNIEDQEEDVSTTGELFSISSFGVDYPV